jgi:hypothetical protein
MPVIAGVEDRLASPVAPPVDGGRQAAASYAGSIAAHALCAALLLLVVGFRVSPPVVIMTAIEVVLEPAPPASPASPASPAPAALPQARADDLHGWARYGFDTRPFADAERQRKGAPDARTIDGRGTDKVATLAPRNGAEKRDGEDLKNDPDKEAIRIVPPLASDARWRQEATLAPPGPEGAAWAPEGVKQDDDATARERQPIQCGGNAKSKTATSSRPLRAQVLEILNERQKSLTKDFTEAKHDLHTSPEYLELAQALVEIDVTRRRMVVMLPQGMSARIGDRLEFMTGRLDPARPCHLIPNLATRVL